MNKPNILLLISHDTGRHLGCYGRNVHTPEINRMAEKGVQFNEYFCSSPQCSPSRGSILTGRYAHNHGMIGLAHLGFSINAETPTLPSEMSKAGYETVLFGLSHETIGEAGGERFTSTYKLGYERYEEVDQNRASDVAERVRHFLSEKAADKSGRPFYASVGFFETHRDFDEYEHAADPDDLVEIPPYLPDTPKVRRDFAQFNGSVKVLDSAVGQIIRALEDTGLEENTLVIYTTDHGIAFPRAKGTFTDAGLETALIMYCPKMLRGGRVQNEMLCNIDLMPTLLDWVGADMPEGLDGQSFMPLLKEQPFQPREQFFCELTWHDWYHPMRGLRTPQFKYLKNFIEGPSKYLPLDIHRSLSGQSVRESYYVPNVPEELYDLYEDPLEHNNLAADPEYAEVISNLRNRVAEWMEQTNDPLLKGPIEGKAAPEWNVEIENGSAYIRK